VPENYIRAGSEYSVRQTSAASPNAGQGF